MLTKFEQIQLERWPLVRLTDEEAIEIENTPMLTDSEIVCLKIILQAFISINGSDDDPIIRATVKSAEGALSKISKGLRRDLPSYSE